MNLHVNMDVLSPMHKAVSDSCPIKTYSNNQPHLTDNGHTKEAVTHPWTPWAPLWCAQWCTGPSERSKCSLLLLNIRKKCSLLLLNIWKKQVFTATARQLCVKQWAYFSITHTRVKHMGKTLKHKDKTHKSNTRVKTHWKMRVKTPWKTRAKTCWNTVVKPTETHSKMYSRTLTRQTENKILLWKSEHSQQPFPSFSAL